MDKNGFSLIEIVFTIIIIGLAMGAITESFIAGSAKSVNVVNEETAVNVAKQEMAALNYCRNGWTVTGVCSAFLNGGGSGASPWITNSTNPTNLSNFAPNQAATPINNECFYTMIAASNVDFNDTVGNGKIQNTSPPNSTSDFIQTIVQTGWFSPSGGNCSTVPASYPYITLSTVYANY